MRGRIVLFVILAVVTALVGVYAGWSTTTPKAIGEPATPADSPVASPKLPTPKLPTPEQPTSEQPTSEQPTSEQPTSEQPTPSGEVRFGRVVVTEPSDDHDLIVSPGNDAFTLQFHDLAVTDELEVPARLFAMTMPLTDGAKGKTLSVHVQGYAHVEEGTSARLTLTVNGLVKVKDFPAGVDDSFQHTLRLPAIPATTYQLEGVIEVLRDPGSDGLASLNVITLDSEIA